MKKDEPKEPGRTTAGGSPFKRFEQIVKKIISVPKALVDDRDPKKR